jgi:hypothetical protein
MGRSMTRLIFEGTEGDQRRSMAKLIFEGTEGDQRRLNKSQSKFLNET